MNQFGLIIFSFVLASTVNPTAGQAGLKDKIKERWMEKQRAEPAPELSSEKGKLDKPGLYTFEIIMGDIKRYYMIHIPTNYKKAVPAPLILALHGGGGNMKIQSQDKFYGLISKSNKEGFVVAFPNGYSELASGALATWNAGECCGKARDEKIDDVAFIKAVLQKIKTQASIDDKKVFAIGMSNGGMMAYRLACEAPELFKGIASVAGTDSTINCTPKKAVSILHIHAKDDGHVQFNGGAGPKAVKDKSKITQFKSVPMTISKWRGLYSCVPDTTKVVDSKMAYCDLYQGCMDGAKIQLCVTEDGGHSWPGSKASPLKKRASSSKALIANDVIWDFFK